MRNGIGFRRGGKLGATDAGDWRQAIWNRWLISYLTPRDEDSASEGATDAKPAYDEPKKTADEAPFAAASADKAPPTPREKPSSPEARAAPLGDSSDSSFPARASARARFDALLEQVYSLEGTVDALVQRFQRTSAQERLEIRRITEGLDRVAELEERHTDALLSCTRALERLERRMMSFERYALSRPLGELRPPTGTFHSEPPRTLDPEFREALTPSGRPRAPASGTRLGPDSGQAFQGNLSDLSVPTLLSMFELEHRTGAFEIETDEQLLLVQLAMGKLVSVIQNGVDADPVDALASVIEQRQGRFTFTPTSGPVTPSDQTVSIGSVLLRVSQKSDEENRVLYAT